MRLKNDDVDSTVKRNEFLSHFDNKKRYTSSVLEQNDYTQYSNGKVVINGIEINVDVEDRNVILEQPIDFKSLKIYAVHKILDNNFIVLETVDERSHYIVLPNDINRTSPLLTFHRCDYIETIENSNDFVIISNDRSYQGAEILCARNPDTSISVESVDIDLIEREPNIISYKNRDKQIIYDNVFFRKFENVDIKNCTTEDEQKYLEVLRDLVQNRYYIKNISEAKRHLNNGLKLSKQEKVKREYEHIQKQYVRDNITLYEYEEKVMEFLQKNEWNEKTISA